MREIILDTETTGLSLKEGHRIIEIGCVEMSQGITTGIIFHKYINPERDIDNGAYAVHGLSKEFLNQFPTFNGIHEEFIEFIADATLVIHNAKFDIGFLNFELSLLGVKELSNNVVDTLSLARKKKPGSPASLNALCKNFDIDLSSRTYHGALLDAQLLSKVYIHLTGGAQASLLSETKKSEETTAAYFAPAIHREKRTFSVSTEESALHDSLIDFLGAERW